MALMKYLIFYIHEIFSGSHPFFSSILVSPKAVILIKTYCLLKKMKPLYEVTSFHFFTPIFRVYKKVLFFARHEHYFGQTNIKYPSGSNRDVPFLFFLSVFCQAFGSCPSLDFFSQISNF